MSSVREISYQVCKVDLISSLTRQKIRWTWPVTMARN